MFTQTASMNCTERARVVMRQTERSSNRSRMYEITFDVSAMAKVPNLMLVLLENTGAASTPEANACDVSDKPYFSSRTWALLGPLDEPVEATGDLDDFRFFGFTQSATEICANDPKCAYVSVKTDASYKMFKSSRCQNVDRHRRTVEYLRSLRLKRWGKLKSGRSETTSPNANTSQGAPRRGAPALARCFLLSSAAARRGATEIFRIFPLIHKVAVYQSSGTCKISAAFSGRHQLFFGESRLLETPLASARAPPRASRRSFKRNRVESRHTPTRERTNEPSRDANLRQDAHGQDDHARGRVLGHDRQRQGEDSRQGRCGKTDRMNRRRGLRRLRSGIAARSAGASADADGDAGDDGGRG